VKTIDTQELSLNKALQALAAKITDAKEKANFETEMEGYLELFRRFKSNRGKLIDWEKIKPPKENLVVPHRTLEKAAEASIPEMAKKLCVVKLNGGLGTSMGCTGPKSVIEVHSELSFLDLTVGQIEDLNNRYKVDVPLYS